MNRAIEDSLKAAFKTFNDGELKRSEAHVRAVLQEMPDNPHALILLGAILGQTDRLTDAVEILKRASNAAPNNPDAVYNLGIALIGTGRWQEARRTLEDVVQRWPNHPFAYNNLGITLDRLGEQGAACRAHEKAVEINPAFLDGHLNLILCQLGQRQATQALRSCNRLIARAPKNSRGYVLKSRALVKLGRFNEALECCLTARELAPGNLESMMTLADVYRRLGRSEDAIAVYKQATDVDEHRGTVYHELGITYREAGRFEEATAAFQDALAADPGHASSLAMLASLKRFAPGDPEYEQLEHTLDSLEAGSLPWAQICFALGKVLEDSGDADRAFGFYEDGTRVLRKVYGSDMERLASDHETLRNCFTRERLHATARAPQDRPNPIFIVGMPRSGTSLVEQILGSHSAVKCGGELSLLRDLAMDQIDGFPVGLANAPAEVWDSIGLRYLAGVKELLGAAQWFTDKMPRNFELLGLICEALPQARIVHCQRAPLDTCVSCYTINFAGRQRFSNDLTDLGTAYRLYRELMDHWRQALPPGRMLDVVYEDLVENPETQVRRLVKHCGLDWESNCLSFHERGGTVRTASVSQVRKPIYNSSIGRYKKFEDHLKPLKDALAKPEIPVD